MECNRCHSASEQGSLKIGQYDICSECATYLLESLLNGEGIEDLETRVNCMRLLKQASRLSDAKEKVWSRVNNILIHLCKIYYLRDRLELNHWKREIAVWIKDINQIDIKISKGRFDKKWLYSELFDSIIGGSKDLKEYIKFTVNPELERDFIDYKKVSKQDYENFSRFYKDLAFDLSYKNLKSNQAIYDHIEKFLRRSHRGF